MRRGKKGTVLVPVGTSSACSRTESGAGGMVGPSLCVTLLPPDDGLGSVAASEAGRSYAEIVKYMAAPQATMPAMDQRMRFSDFACAILGSSSSVAGFGWYLLFRASALPKDGGGAAKLALRRAAKTDLAGNAADCGLHAQRCRDTRNRIGEGFMVVESQKWENTPRV